MTEKKRILFVDDEEELVELMAFRLESFGFDVSKAYNGAEALEAVKKERPDLILLDIAMPKMDGYEVCRILKSDEKYRDLPVIFLTAKAQADEKKAAQEIGADDYIAKPFEPAELLEKINKLL